MSCLTVALVQLQSSHRQPSYRKEALDIVHVVSQEMYYFVDFASSKRADEC